jgi:hypothetical protein
MIFYGFSLLRFFYLFQIEFYGDFDGSFHKSLELTTDLSGALLGTRSERYITYPPGMNLSALSNLETVVVCNFQNSFDKSFFYFSFS